MERKQKKRERNSMSSKEKDEMHLNARNNVNKLRLVMSPPQKAEMNTKKRNRMKNSHNSPNKKAELNVKACKIDEEFYPCLQKKGRNVYEST